MSALPATERLFDLVSQAWIAAHRVAGFALLNLLDDPALLALAFC